MSDREQPSANAWSAGRQSWEDERLQPALTRAPERRPRFSTLSDVEVARLYGPWDWEPAADREPRGGGGPTAVDHRGDRLATGRWDDFDPARDIGLPGEPPFTRGIHPTGYRSRLWTMRMFAGFGAAEDTNARSGIFQSGRRVLRARWLVRQSSTTPPRTSTGTQSASAWVDLSDW